MSLTRGIVHRPPSGHHPLSPERQFYTLVRTLLQRRCQSHQTGADGGTFSLPGHDRRTLICPSASSESGCHQRTDNSGLSNGRGNVIFIRPSGVGKTHLSIALDQIALEQGISVQFYSVIKLVEYLEKAYIAGNFEQVFKDANRPKLLILDEVGFMPLTPRQEKILFQLIPARYERKVLL